jgi:hypothetical protein
MTTIPETRMPARLTRLAPLALLTVLAACAAPDPLTDELPNMGDFRLGHNIVVADNMQQVPPSRNATPEEWVEILTAEIDRRFGQYEGDRLYHIGIAVDGYALAPPGIPLVLNPRSVLVLSVNVWDDAAGVKLHEEPEQILVMEGASTETAFIGSGIARTREEQMQVLARNAARQIQNWMLDNPEWFSIDPDAPPFREAVDPADVAAPAETAAAAEPVVEATPTLLPPAPVP